VRHIHPLQPLAVILLVVVFFYLRRKKPAAPPALGRAAKGLEPRAAVEKPVKPPKPPKPPMPEEPPEVAFMNLRRRALEATPESVGLAGLLADDEPYGLLMEIGMPGSVVTLACSAAGDASLYYQTGGGMVGGIGHDGVRRLAKEFVAAARGALSRMAPAPDQPLPDPDRVRFYALTPRGIFTAEMDRQDLGETESEFSSLFYGGQEIVARMRQVLAQRAG
jgi:hypothetical protein